MELLAKTFLVLAIVFAFFVFLELICFWAARHEAAKSRKGD